MTITRPFVGEIPVTHEIARVRRISPVCLKRNQQRAKALRMNWGSVAVFRIEISSRAEQALPQHVQPLA